MPAAYALACCRKASQVEPSGSGTATLRLGLASLTDTNTSLDASCAAKGILLLSALELVVRWQEARHGMGSWITRAGAPGPIGTRPALCSQGLPLLHTPCLPTDDPGTQ